MAFTLLSSKSKFTDTILIRMLYDTIYCPHISICIIEQRAKQRPHSLDDAYPIRPFQLFNNYIYGEVVKLS